MKITITVDCPNLEQTILHQKDISDVGYLEFELLDDDFYDCAITLDKESGTQRILLKLKEFEFAIAKLKEYKELEAES